MNKISGWTLISCILFMIFSAFFFYPRWKQSNTEATISWDVSGYYMYLPSLFIYKDIKKCDFKDTILERYHPTWDFQQAYLHPPTGNYIMKYSSGQAIAMLPWFGVAHLWAKSSNRYPADGFSYPYQKSIAIGMLIYALIGLMLLRKLLLRYFKDTTVSLLLVLYVLGTNYFNFTVVDQAMTHNVLFLIYVLICILSVEFHKRPNPYALLSISLLCGFVVLIRPTEIISILIPLGWGINRFSEIIPRIRFWYRRWYDVVMAGVLIFLVFSIQLLYWKYVSGHWFIYSYQDQGFSWLHPHWRDYLWSYSCGWLRYCPMMIWAFVGLIPFLYRRISTLMITGFILLSVYLVTAWDVWDYGGTAGRAMIQYYPILAFPFASLLEWINEKARITKYLFYGFSLLFVYLNVWWTWNAHCGNVQVAGLTKEYYFRMAGRWNATEDDQKLLDNVTSFKKIPKSTVLLYANHFNEDTSKNKTEWNGNPAIHLNRELQSSENYCLQRNSDKIRIRIFARFISKEKEYEVWKQAQFILKFYRGKEELQTNMIRVFRFLKENDNRVLYMDAMVPESWTHLCIGFWNAGSDRELIIDDLKLIGFD